MPPSGPNIAAKERGTKHNLWSDTVFAIRGSPVWFYLNMFDSFLISGPGPGRYALPSTVGFEAHDATKKTDPAYSFGRRLIFKDNSMIHNYLH